MRGEIMSLDETVDELHGTAHRHMTVYTNVQAVRVSVGGFSLD